MNVSRVGMTQVQPKYNKRNAAAKGALYTAGVLGTSTAISWVKTPDVMKSVVAKNGGKAKYALKYMGWLAAFTAMGSLVNTVLSVIADKVKPNYPPKAN